MEKYNQRLKQPARTLRSNMTDAEQKLWYYLRRKQIQGVQFYRQKPLLNFIVDFYCHAAKLVIELDGSQHADTIHQLKDQKRSELLEGLGLAVLRFDNRQVLLEIEAVLVVINAAVVERKSPQPPFKKGGAIQVLSFKKGGSSTSSSPWRRITSSPFVSSPLFKGGLGGIL